MSTFQISMALLGGTFPEYMDRKHGVVQRAATSTMDEIRDIALGYGRGSIASAGFPVGLQKALRAVRYPRQGVAVNAAVLMWHRSNYGYLFEHGGTVAPGKTMWLPLAGTPPKLGKARVTPAELSRRDIDLVSMRSKSGTPLLGARVLTGKRGKWESNDVSVKWGDLKRGASAAKGPFTTIPLFHGIKSATHRKRWDVLGAAERARQEIPRIFNDAFVKEEKRDGQG